MFTGIIEEVGFIKSIQPNRLTVSAHKILEGTQLGDSIAINGICLTVISISNDTFSVDIMPETLHRTNLNTITPGQAVNLERALAANGRLGGHFVQGHIDGIGKILSMTPDGEAVLMKISAPPEIMKSLVEKGFIAIDGISLTITQCDKTSFTVSLVSYTRQITTLGIRKAGDVVNVEVDILSKYIEKMAATTKPGISLEFLSEHGFLAT